MSSGLRIIADEVSACCACPRLVSYREDVAREKRRAFREWTYWGRGVPGFGDDTAQLFILGLAPAAHGANRTGRVFTGDRSGEFLFRALYEAGFANQPTSLRVADGLRLKNAYIAAAVRCAPPANKPLPVEILNCRGYLQRELEILQPRALLALGKIAWDAYLKVLKHQDLVATRGGYKFAHGAEQELGKGRPRLFGVYHPSQQNTQTGLLTAAMYAKAGLDAKGIVAKVFEALGRDLRRGCFGFAGVKRNDTDGMVQLGWTGLWRFRLWLGRHYRLLGT